jgi:hypothetical protein
MNNGVYLKLPEGEIKFKLLDRKWLHRMKPAEARKTLF